MKRSSLAAALLCGLWALPACQPTGVDGDDDTSEPVCDNESLPTIEVQWIEDSQPVGVAVDVLAQVTDPEGISVVSLYYRLEGQSAFTYTFMSNEGTGDSSIYVGTIPAAYVGDPGVEYYVRATDQVSPCTAESFAPADAPDSYGHFSTRLDLTVLPFYETFDVEEGDCSDAELDSLGWLVAYESFPQSIHNWRFDDRNPLSGACSASHSEGIPGGFWECPPPDGEGNIVRKNWLISPPLDFSGKTSIAVRWFERQQDFGICSESHALYVSTDFPEPDVGTYTQVAEVPLGGSAWNSSAWYDLSDYAGNEKVYVALYYEAGAAGRWQVDDLYIGEPLADLQLAEAPTLAATAAPGTTGHSLSLSLLNASTLYSAPVLTATLSSSDADLSITQAASTFPAVAPNATVVQDGAAFSFDIGSGHPDNAYLDFALTLDDGVGHQWTIPIRLLMGQESTAMVSLSAAGDVHMELGHGSPDAPGYAVSTDAISLAGAAWELNITEEAAMLPPGAGVRRWFLRATNDSDVDAVVTEWEFNVGGVDWVAEGIPADVPAGESVTLVLPIPPALSVVGFSTDPEPAAPGASISIENLALQNDGYATAGGLSCILGSSHEDASGFDTTPVSFGSDPIAADELREAEGEFSVTLAATHTDASPVPLTLVCSDGADTLTPSFALPIPYAHPVIDSVRIDDSTGNGDGYADPGEVVDVYVSVRNDGDFATIDAVTLSATSGTGSTASFVLSGGTLTFGSAALEPAAVVESTEALSISVGVEGLLGDSMVLDLIWASGADTWSETTTVEVTGLPWISCVTEDDPQGDVEGSGTIDIQTCAFRSDDTMLQVRLDAWETFVTSTAFVDFFFFETPGQFAIESVAGSADFEDGCVFGDDLIETVPISVQAQSDSSISVRVALIDMAITGSNTQVAFGAGSCSDIYFCDTFPDDALSFNVAAGTYSCPGSAFLSLEW